MDKLFAATLSNHFRKKSTNSTLSNHFRKKSTNTISALFGKPKTPIQKALKKYLPVK